MNNKLFKKFLTYFYGSGIGLIIGIITTVVSTRILSPEDFGKASMFTLAVNVVMIFIVFGTDQAFVRFFYEEEKDRRGKLLLNTLKIPLLLLFICLLLLVLFYEYLMMFLFDEINYFIFIILLVAITSSVFYRFSLLVIRMQQKAHLYSLVEILNKLINLVLLVALFYIVGPSYEIIIYSTVITLLSLTIISILFERKIWSQFKIKSESLKHTQSEILKFSYPLVLTTLIVWLFQSFDKIALRNWSTFEELGLYSAAFRIVALLTVVQATFSTFWAPVCYEHFEKNPNQKDFFTKTTGIISLVMFTISILTIMFKDIIIILLGQEYRAAALIMPFLIFMPLLYTISETTVIGINFYKKTKWHIIIAGLACIMNIAGNFLLVPIYGATGAAISTGLSYVLFFILRTQISLKYYYVNYNLKRIYVMIVLLLIYGIQNSFSTQDFMSYFLGNSLLIILGILYKSEVINITSLVKNYYLKMKLK